MSDKQDSDFFELIGTVIGILVRGRFLLIASFVLGAVLGGAIAFTSTPVYRSSVLIAMAQDSTAGSTLPPELAGVASLVGIRAGSQQNAEESVALLSSKRLTYQFISQNSLLPKFFDKRWDEKKTDWKTPEDTPTDLEGFELFDRKIRTVYRDARTGLITLSIDWRDPMESAKWANDLVRLANDLNRSVAVNDAQSQLDFVERQLGKTEGLTARAVLYKIMEEQMTRIAVASTRDEYAFRMIDPAVPADTDRPLKPRKAMLIVTAAFLGLFFGLFLLLAFVVKERIGSTTPS